MIIHDAASSVRFVQTGNVCATQFTILAVIAMVLGAHYAAALMQCFWVSLVWCDSGFCVFLDEPWSWHSMKPRWNNHPAGNSSTGHMCNGWFTFSCLSFDDWTLNALVVITCCNHSRKQSGQRLSGGYVSNTWLWWVFGRVEHDQIYRKVFLLDLSWMSTYNHFTAKPSYIFGSPWAP